MNSMELSMKVVKDNALINASYNLDLVEQRLILLAIVEARESGKGINANDPLTVHADSYISQFNVTRQTAYEALKNACDDLFVRQFSYQSQNKRGNIQTHRSRWVSEVIYVDSEAKVKIIFAPAIIPLITRLEQQFTSYELNQVSLLSSKYAMRLYELLIGWRSAGKTPVFELEEFRSKLGLDSKEYSPMCNFKKYVLDLAVKQINEHTDITTTYEQSKQGRKITGFSFKFKPKPQRKKGTSSPRPRDQNTPDMFTGKTDKEVKTAVNKAVVKDHVPPTNPLQHRASRITTAIRTNGLHDRFKHGDEGIFSTLKRIQEEIVTGGDDTAEFWQNKLEEFGVIFD